MNNLGSNIYVDTWERPRISNEIMYEEEEKQGVVVNNYLKELEKYKKQLEDNQTEYSLKISELENRLKGAESLTQILTDKDDLNTQEIQVLKNSKQSLQDQIELLNENVREISIKLGTAESDLKIRESKLIILEKQIGELSELNTNYAYELENNFKDSSKKEEKIYNENLIKLKQLQEENLKLSFQLRNTEKAQELAIKTKILENERKLDNQLNDLKQELMMLRAEQQNNERIIKTQHEELIAKDSKLLSVQNENTVKSKQIMDFYSEKKNLQGELHALKNTLELSENNVKLSLLNNIKESAQDVEGNIEYINLNNKYQALNKENILLKSQVKSLQNIEKVNDTFAQSSLKKQIKEQMEKIGTLEKEITNLEKKIIDNDSDLKTKKEVIEQLKNTIETMQKNIDKMSLLIKSKDKELTQNKKQLSELESNILAKDLEIFNLTKQIETMETKLNLGSNDADIRILKEKLNKLQEDLGTQKKEYEEIIEKSNLQVKEKINIIKTNTEELTKLRDEKTDLETRMKTIMWDLEDKNKKISILQEQSSDFQMKIEEVQNNLNLERTEKNAIINKLEVYVQESNNMANLYEAQNLEFKRENQYFRTQIENYNHVIFNTNYQNQKLEEINNDLTKANQNMQIISNDLHNKIQLNNEMEQNDLQLTEEINSYYNLYREDYDSFYIAANEQILNLRQFTMRYITPLLDFLDSFFLLQKAHLLFAKNAHHGFMEGIKQYVDIQYDELTRSKKRLSNFKSQMKKEDLHIALNSYYQTLSIITAYQKKLKDTPQLVVLETYFNQLYSSLFNLKEISQNSLKKVKSKSSVVAIETILGLCYTNETSLEILKNIIKDTNLAWISFSNVVNKIITGVQSFKKHSEEIVQLQLDMVETINFISPSFNNVGNLGCELLMFIKNALIELEDINYGKSRNTLIVNHKNLKKVWEIFDNNGKSELQSQMTYLATLYNLKKVFAMTFIKEKLLKEPDGRDFILSYPARTENEVGILDACFANVSTINNFETGYTLKFGNNNMISNKENKIEVLEILKNASISKEVFFLWMYTMIDRMIIKLEVLSNSNIFVNAYSNEDMNSTFLSIAKNMMYTDFNSQMNFTTGDGVSFFMFQKAFYFIFSNLSVLTSDRQLNNELKIKRKNPIRYLKESFKKVSDKFITSPIQAKDEIIQSVYNTGTKLIDKIKQVKNYSKNTFQNLTHFYLAKGLDALKNVPSKIGQFKTGLVDFVKKQYTRFIPVNKIPSPTNIKPFYTQGTIGDQDIKSEQEIRVIDENMYASVVEQNILEKNLLTGVKKSELNLSLKENDEYDELLEDQYDDDVSTQDDAPEEYTERLNDIDNLQNNHFVSQQRNDHIVKMVQNLKTFKSLPSAKGKNGFQTPQNLDELNIEKPQTIRKLNFSKLGQAGYVSEFNQKFNLSNKANTL